MAWDSGAPSVTLDLKTLEPNELVRRVQLGCSDSATELSNRFTPKLLTLIERRLPGRRSDAEDIVQEALTRAFQRLDQFDHQFKFSTWLYTIAIRICTDQIRKEKRRPKSISLEHIDSVNELHTDAKVSKLEDGAKNIWSVAKTHLTETQFTILWLKYAESLTIQEIGKILGKTQIGVRVQLHRTREKLGKIMRGQDGDSSFEQEHRGVS